MVKQAATRFSEILWFQSTVVFCLTFGALPVGFADEPKPVSVAPSLLTDEAQGLQLKEIGGSKVAPLAPAEGEFSIVLFTATECPIANAFSPEIARIATEFSEKHCRLFLVYTDPELTKDGIRTHLADYSLKPATAILDKKQRLVAAIGATHTPEAALIDSKGKVLYQGRINNRYAALGKKRRVVTSHDLRDALIAATAGRPVKISRTQPIGCTLPTPIGLDSKP
jgi:hypothetical protein